MGKNTIIDTGWLTTARQGTQNTGTTITSLSNYRANNGSAITLNNSQIGLQSSANISDDPNPSSDDITELHYTSFNNRVFDINCIFDASSTTETNLLKEVLVLERTSGIKLFYNSDTNNNIKTLPEIIGRTGTVFHGNEVSGGIPVIVGRLIKTSLNEISTSRKYKFIVTLTFEEDKI